MSRNAIALALSIFCLLPVSAHGQDRWASYSVNPQSGAWGFAMGRSSANGAYNDARNGCGRTGCHEVLSKFAPCIALYVIYSNGRQIFGAGSGNTLGAAENVAKRRFTATAKPQRVHGLCFN